MATLKAMFKLFDGYSRTIDVIDRKTQQATDKILKASGATDKFNSQLAATGVNAGKASSGLSGLIGKVVTIAGIMKGISIADEYTNTSARLGLITDNLEEQKALQDQIYAAAERSRGSYTDMAAAVAKMGVNAGEAFGGNTDQIVRFTELMQKTFRLGGASSSEQSSAMLQLTQAMASGQLQGDEYKSIRENAPMFAKAIEDYMKNVLKLEGTMKDWSADGLITTEVMKNSLFRMADEIDKKASKLPLTFGDYWNAIKRGASKAFAPVIEQINKMINTEKFKRFADNMIGGFDAIAKGASKALDAISGIFDFVTTNWDKIDDVIYAAAAAWGTYELALQGVRLAQWALDFASMINPIGLTIILVTALAAAFILLWEKCEGFRKFWANLWADNMKSAARTFNFFANINNKISEWLENGMERWKSVVNAYRNMAIAMITVAENVSKAIVNSFEPITDWVNKFISQYNTIANVLGMKTIDTKFDKESLSSSIDKLADTYINDVKNAATDINSFLDKIQLKKVPLFDIEDIDKKVDDMTKQIENFTISGWLKGIFNDTTDALENAITSSQPVEINGDGPGGSVPVSMDDDDLEYLRAIAEREYINKFSTATLAPNVTFTFGDIHETADIEVVRGKLEAMMREEIATASEGSY